MMPIVIPLFEVGSTLAHIVDAMGPQGVAGSLLGTGILGAVIKALIDKYKPRVDREAAANAEHERAADMSLSLADRLQAEMARMGTRMQALEDKLDAQTLRGDRLELKVRDQEGVLFSLRAYVARVADWYQHRLVADWERIRAEPTPPTMPRYEER